MPVYTKENTKIAGMVPPRMKDLYTLRVKKAEFKMSASSGNPMIVLSTEIIKPLEFKAADGKTYSLDTLEPTYYLVLTEKNIGNLLDLYERLGLDNNIDTDNPNVSIWEGLTFDAVLDSREVQATRPDPEKPGQFIPILDAEGKPLKGRWEIVTNLKEIYHLSSVDTTNRPY